MPRRKSLLLIAFVLFIVSPIFVAAVAATPDPAADESDPQYWPVANTPPVSSSINVNFRTCPGDTDLATLISRTSNRVSEGVYFGSANQLYFDDATPSCDHIQYKCLFSTRVDCTETPQGYAWKCINYSTSRISYSHDRSITGTRQSNCSIPKKKIPGECSTSRNQCIAGEVGNIASSTLSYVWSCFGTGGASTDQCEEKIPQVVDGKCGNIKNICSRGTLASPGDNGTEFTWMCLGENEGKKANCSIKKPFKGECGSTFFSCLAGTLTRQTTFTERYLWSCEGYASSTANCTKDRVASGKCSTKLANTCDDGYLANTKKTNTANTWDCTGVNNGGDVSCSLNFPASNGICSSSHYRCGSGVGINTVASTNIWSWVCPGFFGGSAVSCTESMGVKKGSCSSKRNECNVGTPAAISEGDSSYSWSCIGPNKGGDVNCEEKKKTEGLCSDVLNTCAPGEVMYKHESNSMFSWMCNGAAGGGSEYCSQPKDNNASTTAICNPKHYSCNAGKVTDKIAGDKNWTWNCDGGVGGKNASCQEIKPIIDKPCDPTDTQCLIDKCKGDVACKGLCGATHDVCSIGTSSASSSDKNAFKWSCVGPKNGGSVNCVEPKVIDGVCADTRNTCTAGEVISKVTGTLMYTWSCKGIVGGATESCSVAKNPALKVDAVCGKTHSSCLKGNSINKVELKDAWNWTCDGNVGGKSVSCTEVKKNTGTGTGTGNASSTAGTVCSLNDVACIVSQCNGDTTCEDTIKACASGKIKCAGGLVINHDPANSDKDGYCALNDIECLSKQCKSNLTCEDKLKRCFKGEISCVEKFVILPEIKNAICAPTDLACLLKKCGGNLSCENALRKCKKGDQKCIDLALSKSNNKYGPQFKENNGTCSSKVFSCTYGTEYDNIRDVDSYRWSCIGKNGGFSSSCKVDYPKNAVCSTKTHNTCDIGTPIKISETASVWNWTCAGIGGGTPIACSMNIVPLAGVCMDQIKSCTVGKPINYILNGDWNEWTCSGSYGGSNTGCFKEVKGTCSAKRYSCVSGTIDAKNETDVGYSWKCRGANGDLTVSCFEKKPIINSSSSAASSTASSTKSQASSTPVI